MSEWLMVLLAVPLTLLLDALLDPDKRAKLWAWTDTGPETNIRQVSHGRWRGGGYRPRPSSRPKSPPPGSCGVPRKVNPATIRPPRSPSAVVPPRPWIGRRR